MIDNLCFDELGDPVSPVYPDVYGSDEPAEETSGNVFRDLALYLAADGSYEQVRARALWLIVEYGTCRDYFIVNASRVPEHRMRFLNKRDKMALSAVCEYLLRSKTIASMVSRACVFVEYINPALLNNTLASLLGVSSRMARMYRREFRERFGL